MLQPEQLTEALKGFPHGHPPVLLSEVAAQGWHLLDGRLPLPLAVLKRSALEHNLAWMQEFVRQRGIDLAPHGKTTMSPQLFRRQLDAGAWGITFANVAQLAVGVAAGVRRALIANQVFSAADLAGLQGLRQAHAGLEVAFLVDSAAQLDLIEAWCAAQRGSAPFDVLLEVGVPGGRTGSRGHDEALALARRLRASPAARLRGLECYEGLGASGRSEDDAARTDALMSRVEALARACAAEALFEGEELLMSAGGSALFDLVAGRLKPDLGPGFGRPVRGLLRSGCYLTHDHGQYGRMLAAVAVRCGCEQTLQPALEVWATVQSCPEPGLALLNAGRRDLSFDIELPVPLWRAALGSLRPQLVPPGWKISALNDQHAHLRWDAADTAVHAAAPVVGERVALGISHPCTTFDKWPWMAVVDDDYRLVDAILTHF